jgi:hypothetical protein
MVGDGTFVDDTEHAATDPYGWWRAQRVSRQAAVDSYIDANKADYQWFKNAPLGNSGIPMIMFRLFPELFPEIWGAEGDHFAAIGLAADTAEPGRVLPLGLGYTGSVPAIQTQAGPVNLQVVQLTCMGCHGARVATPAGVQTIVGAPNHQFTSFRQAVARTVTSPGYTAQRFRDALAAKPLGWVYGDPAMVRQEALERAIFMAPGSAEQFLGGLQSKAIAGAQRSAATMGAYTYANVPNPPDLNGPTPGYLDAIGAGIAIIVDPAKFTPDQLRAILPPAPGPVDIMSVWKQNDRPAAQWDNSIGSPLHRNLAAEFGVLGNPTAVSMENGVRTTRFTSALPSAPYPFDVDYQAAKRGQELYAAYCASCHSAGNDHLFAPGDVGTDPNRANIFTPYTAGGLIQMLRIACTDPVACNQADGSPTPDEEIALPTFAYAAVPLDGIWARAPYLHNGSVPTLSALLTGDRPATFYRGNITYDQVNVGYTWKTGGPGAALYDTTRSGLSNAGHTGVRFLGDIDWKKNANKRADLLEYLKTL